jgi:hypothetical protein
MAGRQKGHMRRVLRGEDFIIDPRHRVSVGFATRQKYRRLEGLRKTNRGDGSALSSGSLEEEVSETGDVMAAIDQKARCQSA